MIKINVLLNNKAWKRYIKNPNVFINQKLIKLNKKFKKHEKKIIFCSIMLSENEKIKKLNKKFRKKNKTTDILSFPFYNKKDLKIKLKKEKEIYLGDIIINFNKIENANSKSKFLSEFNKLWVHGLAHLFGYDHKKNSDFNKMIKFEKKILSFIS